MDCSPLACLRQALERKLCKETAFVAADVAGLSANWICRLPPFPGDRLRRSGGAKRRAKAGQRRGRKQAERALVRYQTWFPACFLPRLSPAFALPGNSLDDIGQTGGDCLFYVLKPVRLLRSRRRSLLAKSSRARSSRTFPLQLLVSHSHHRS